MRILKVYKDDRYLFIDTDEGIRKQKLTYSGSDELEEECHRLSQKGCLVNHRTVPGWSRDEWFVDIWEIDENTNIVKRKTTKDKIQTIIHTRRLYQDPPTYQGS